MVDQNGEIIQFVREQDTAWHARGANRRSIGIEHVAIQQGGARYPGRRRVQTSPTRRLPTLSTVPRPHWSPICARSTA